MIRPVTKEDKDQVLALIQLFFKERLEKEGTQFSKENADIHFDLFINNPQTLALCAIDNDQLVGIIAGTASAILFAKELAMQEMVWYVKPDKRKCGLKLLREFEKRSKDLGVQHVMMVGMTGDPVLSTYERLGYKETQITFFKKV